MPPARASVVILIPVPDGQAYRGSTTLSDTQWAPGDALTLCVNPGEPAAHVVNFEAKPCGSESVNFGKISTGTPTSSPGGKS